MSARNFDVNKAKKYGNVTVEHNQDSPKGEIIHIRLHQTYVVRFDRETKRVTLNSGGWRTVTTKQAINTALKQLQEYTDFRQVGVYQEKGEWFLHTGVSKVPFVDGMVFEMKAGRPVRVLSK